MTTTINKRNLILTILVAAVLTVLCNALISLTSVGMGAASEVVPKGWGWVDQIVGFVWIGLLCCLSVAWWIVRRASTDKAAGVSQWIILLGGGCLIYPFTFGLTARGGLLGNIIIAMFAAWLSRECYRISRPAAFLVLPIVGWLSVATVYLSLLIRLNNL